MTTVYLDAGKRLSGELRAAELGDARRSERLVKIADRMERRPAEGFPSMMGSNAELEGCYRLLNNDAVAMEPILEPHVDSTFQRASDRNTVLVAHDETTMSFDHADQQDALGELRSGGSTDAFRC